MKKIAKIRHAIKSIKKSHKARSYMSKEKINAQRQYDADVINAMSFLRIASHRNISYRVDHLKEQVKFIVKAIRNANITVDGKKLNTLSYDENIRLGDVKGRLVRTLLTVYGPKKRNEMLAKLKELASYNSVDSSTIALSTNALGQYEFKGYKSNRHYNASNPGLRISTDYGSSSEEFVLSFVVDDGFELLATLRNYPANILEQIKNLNDEDTQARMLVSLLAPNILGELANVGRKDTHEYNSGSKYLEIDGLQDVITAIERTLAKRRL